VRAQTIYGTTYNVRNLNAFGPALGDEDILNVGIEMAQASSLNGGRGSAKNGLLILSTDSVSCCGSR
jgi:hypothetical protein